MKFRSLPAPLAKSINDMFDIDSDAATTHLADTDWCYFITNDISAKKIVDIITSFSDTPIVYIHDIIGSDDVLVMNTTVDNIKRLVKTFQFNKLKETPSKCTTCGK